MATNCCGMGACHGRGSTSTVDSDGSRCIRNVLRKVVGSLEIGCSRDNLLLFWEFFDIAIRAYGSHGDRWDFAPSVLQSGDGSMFAHLVPCSGGKPITLSRAQLFLGRRAAADQAAPLTAECAVYRLRKVEGNWHIELLDSTADLRVNGQRRHAERLNSGDESNTRPPWK
jgi:hypothetical protein